MPLSEGPPKRTLPSDEGFVPNPPAEFVEFGVATAFSFLRGASEPLDMVVAANRLGYDKIGIADRNSLAGVVRMWSEGKTACVDALIGCRLVLTCGAEFLAYPQDRAAYGRLSTLLSKGKMATPDGDWQGKDVTEITLDMLVGHAEGLHLIAMPGADLDIFERVLNRVRCALRTLRHLGANVLYNGQDRTRLTRLAALAKHHGLLMLATNDVLYHDASRRPLQDVMTCIREKVTIKTAGSLLEQNAERHLKSPGQVARIFQDWPEAIHATRHLADQIEFRLTDLKYEYPHEIIPKDCTPMEHLERLTWEGAQLRYPEGLPEHVRQTILKEFDLIGKKNIATYFLTIHDIVTYARTVADPPILCQGRGSAANSAVCFCLGITAVDPNEHDVLFERFLSEERDEPPDIDIDFEHERREEVIQYIYSKYSRQRAGLCATVIHYRPRSAIREVGKVMGLTEDVTSKLSSTVWGSFESKVGDDRVREAGLDLSDPYLRMVLKLARQMIGMPRHLGQHVGGFILTETPLTEIVPIGNAAMPDRSFIEWDKDDIDALGIFKVDVLALGMLTCVAKGFNLLRQHYDIDYDLATVPKEHDFPDDQRPTYDMLCRGESLGVFQVESRAQMAMLPKLRPRVFYDLVIEVAIVRPGPIQGDMVHPYLRRRQGLESIVYPAPGPQHPQDELQKILGRTLGVPIFQEQAMKIAMVAAEFSGAEANKLRKAMATFRAKGQVSAHKDMMITRMVGRGYDEEFATRCFSQIEGFGEYGFPESHAASFAKLVYVSSWMKCHHPNVFACALLNSQPMGFYAPAQIVRDARENGVSVLPIDVNHSDWDCTLEDGALRLGLRQVDGLQQDAMERVMAIRPFRDVEDLRDRARLDRRQMKILAEADALNSLGRTRRDGMWDVMGHADGADAPVFDAAAAPAHGADIPVDLPRMPKAEEVVADYQTTRLSLKAHPMSFFRTSLRQQGYACASELWDKGHGRRVKLAGLVLVRQKPGSAKGVCFITLEDETGVANLVIWPDKFEALRGVIMSSRLMSVTGQVQTDGKVLHVIVQHIENRTDALDNLADVELPPITTRGDHPTHPISNQVKSMPGQRTHPRNVRVIPKSRDFH